MIGTAWLLIGFECTLGCLNLRAATSLTGLAFEKLVGDRIYITAAAFYFNVYY